MVRELIKGWRNTTIGELGRVVTGKTPSTSVNGFFGGDIPFVTPGDLGNSAVVFDAERTLTLAGLERAKPVPRGAVLFTCIGIIGKSAIAGRKLATNQQVNSVVCDPEKVDYRFLYYVLTFHSDRIQRLAGSQAVPIVNKSTFENVAVNIPPLDEQRKIVEVLRNWDKAIEEITNLINLLRSRRVAMRYILFSEHRYAVKTAVFGDFLQESRLTGSDGLVANKITVKLYGMGAVPKNEVRPGSTRTRYFRRTAGQLIYSKLDFLNGAFAIIPQSLNGYESSLDLPAFDISEQVNPKWLIEYLIRPAYYSRQLHLARGQRKARRIAPDDFLASQIKLPDRKVQDRIASALTSADDEIASRCSLLEMYNRQKRGLMQKFLTGIWRVDTTVPRITRPKEI